MRRVRGVRLCLQRGFRSLPSKRPARGHALPAQSRAMLPRAFWIFVRTAIAAGLLGMWAWAGAVPLVLTQAQASQDSGPQFPADGVTQMVRLPDDWSVSRPRYDGPVWYRVGFDV